MKLLLVKTSSLGDLVHTFPALTDAHRHRPDLIIDWVVEEAFVPIAGLHPAVRHVKPVALRRWRRRPAGAVDEFRRFAKALRAETYDLVLDAQGLLKSAGVARLAHGPRVGFDRHSAREPLAAMLYQRRIAVPNGAHAIDRVRQLFAAALGYAQPAGPPRFGLRSAPAPDSPLLFLHGSSWVNKQWPEAFWMALAQRAAKAGHRVLLPWGDADECARAHRIAQAGNAEVAPALMLDELIRVMAAAAGAVAVDSGLGHLAAAFGLPTVALFGPTDPARTGCMGDAVVNLAASLQCAPCRRRRCTYQGPALLHDGVQVSPPCFAALDPERVWRAYQALT
jgi:heptosyltransferase-1